MNQRMQLLFRRLDELKHYLPRYQSTYGGFKGKIVVSEVQGQHQVAIGRLEFTRERLKRDFKSELVQSTLTVHEFQGPPTMFSEFAFEVRDIGLLVHLPAPADMPVLVRLPQTRSSILNSQESEKFAGICWLTHVIEVWTPRLHVPPMPSTGVDLLGDELRLDPVAHWGNLIILMPTFAGRFPLADELGGKTEAIIEYDSCLISKDDLVLTREILEWNSLWDCVSNSISELQPATNGTTNTSDIILRDLASAQSETLKVYPIHGIGGSDYRIKLLKNDGTLLDVQTVPLVREVRVDLEISQDTLIRNLVAKRIERMTVAPNQPWEERMPRNQFSGQPGVWLTQGSEQQVQRILRFLASAAADYVKVVDPYMDTAILRQFLPLLPHNLRVCLITSSVMKRQAFRSCLKELRNGGRHIEVMQIHRKGSPRLTPLHDRFIVTRGMGWYLGTSFNSLATNVSLVAELTPADAKRLEQQFDDWWGSVVLGSDGELSTKVHW